MSRVNRSNAVRCLTGATPSSGSKGDDLSRPPLLTDSTDTNRRENCPTQDAFGLYVSVQ